MEPVEEDIAPNDDPVSRGLLFHRSVWAVWWIGAILVALSWFSLVPNTVGWIGFALTVVSTIASVIYNRYWRMPR